MSVWSIAALLGTLSVIGSVRSPSRGRTGRARRSRCSHTAPAGVLARSRASRCGVRRPRVVRHFNGAVQLIPKTGMVSFAFLLCCGGALLCRSPPGPREEVRASRGTAASNARSEGTGDAHTVRTTRWVLIAAAGLFVLIYH